MEASSKDILPRQEVEKEEVKVFRHEDLTDEDRLYLRGGIMALEEFNQREVGRRQLTVEHINYLLGQRDSFTLISQDSNGLYSYSIYSKARSGETIFLEAYNDQFDTSLPETGILVSRYEEREAILLEHAKKEANSPHFRNYAPAKHVIPEVACDQNGNIVIETRALVKATKKNEVNFVKIPNGENNDGIALNFSNEPSTKELESFLTDKLIAERVLYCPHIDTSDDYTDGERFAPGYIFVCDDKTNDQPGKANVFAELFRQFWKGGKFVKMVDGMPQIPNSVLLPSGLKVQEIIEENCPVTFAFLESYRRRMAQTPLSQGEEDISFVKSLV